MLTSIQFLLANRGHSTTAGSNLNHWFKVKESSWRFKFDSADRQLRGEAQIH